jgi:hypothetical protein
VHFQRSLEEDGTGLRLLWLARLRHCQPDDARMLEHIDLGDIEWLLGTDYSRQASWTAALHPA